MANLKKLLRDYEKDPANPIARQRYQTELMRVYGFNMPAIELLQDLYHWFESNNIQDFHLVAEDKHEGESEVEMNRRVSKIIKERPLESFFIKVSPKIIEDFIHDDKPYIKSLKNLIELRGWKIDVWYYNSLFFVVSPNLQPMLEAFYKWEERNRELIVNERAQTQTGAFLTFPLELAMQKCAEERRSNQYWRDIELSEEVISEFYEKMEVSVFLSSAHLNPHSPRVKKIEDNWTFQVRYLLKEDVTHDGRHNLESEFFRQSFRQFSDLTRSLKRYADRELLIRAGEYHPLEYSAIGDQGDAPYGLTKNSPLLYPQREGLIIAFAFKPNIYLWTELLGRSKKNFKG